jgi:hypothetical protein
MSAAGRLANCENLAGCTEIVGISTRADADE